jgi:hypothetical protein
MDREGERDTNGERGEENNGTSERGRERERERGMKIWKQSPTLQG